MAAVNPTAPSGPLSRDLARLLENSTGDALTANQLIERTEGRGIYFVLIILSLPFVAWISLPGLSTLCGLTMGLLAWRMARGKPPRLPARLGDRRLAPRVKQSILGGGLKLCRLLEKAVRPRRTAWMNWRGAEVAHALLIVLMAALLALPLPSPPFFGSNTLPGYAIILLAVSMMERDGVLIWFGYAMAAGAALYFILLAGLIATQFHKWFELLQPLWEGAA